MSLRSRLDALERLARNEGLLTGEPRCATCGGPGASPISVFLFDEGEVLRCCQECARPIGEDGQPAGSIAVVMTLHDAPTLPT